MRNKLLFSILFILLLSVAHAETLHHVEGLTVSQEIQSGVQFIPTGELYTVQSASMDLYLFAENDAQQQVITNEYGEGFVAIQGNKLKYTWEEPKSTYLPIQLKQTIKTGQTTAKVKHKVPFPLQTLSPDIASYVTFTDHIDRSPEIVAVAQSLAAGETDLFKLEHEIAQWVNTHITYNLSTITSEANIPSSEVIAQRYGVCDEITNLFLSINRELGIPARFVSGIAYSESILFDTKWGNHGWAEVYFPGTGWVPYDVTYDQYGWIDPTHIALGKEVDGTTPALKTLTIGYGYEFATIPLTFKTTIVAQKKQAPPKTTITVTPYEPRINIGSFNVIEAQVTNNNDYYVSEKITLIPTTDLTLLETTTSKRVALAPGESKRLTWVVQVDKDLDTSFKYTFPIGIIDSMGYEQYSEFSVQEDYIFLPYELLPVTTEKTIKKSSVICIGPGAIIENTQGHITCMLPSNATRTKQICLEGVCDDASFTKNATFDVPTTELGVFTVPLTIGTQEQIIVSYRVTDIPAVSINNVSLAENTNYAIPIQLAFNVQKESYSIPKDVNIRVEHELFHQEWDLVALQREQPVAIAIPSELFAWGTNTINIQVSNPDGLLASKEIQLEIKPETVDAYIFASINYGNRILARKGVKNVELRSAITLIMAGTIAFGFLQLLIKLLRHLLLGPRPKRRVNKP